MAEQTAEVSKKRRKWPWVLVGLFVLFVIISVAGNDDKDTNQSGGQQQASSSEQPTPQPANEEQSISKEKAQAELDELMELGKKSGLVESYEFSNKASVVYAGQVWYTQKVDFKKDFLAKVAMLKKAITGFQHFEVRDAYSNEKIAEVTSFTGSLEVYK